MAVTVGLAVLSPLGGTPPAAAAAPSAGERVEVAGLAVELPRQANGRAALRLLGDQVDEAAGLNGLASAELREVLRTDDTAWLTTSGRLYYREPIVAGRAASPAPAAAYPLDQTFALHSKPGSQRTIFIDVGGATVNGTWWHEDAPSTPAIHPAWDPGGNGPDFSNSELAIVQEVWERVADDFAPFDVNVTTEDPGAAAILRSSPLDEEYGAHALVTPSNAWATLCDEECGGVAFIDVFDKAVGAGGNGYGMAQPAWVFPQGLGNHPKSVAEAVSHEVGHQLGLDHDGTSTLDYYGGHGAWAPIMGAGYDRPITHWSKGDYLAANNLQDDLAIIGAILGLRDDEAPEGIAGAPTVPDSAAYLSNRDDADTFLLGDCTGQVTVSAAPVLAAGGNLDLRLRLLDATGTQVASADPPSVMVSAVEATGLDAAITQTLTPGRYYAEVDGVGRGSWATGYDDYGSIGAYRIQVAGECSTAGVPAMPAALAAGTVTVDSIGLTWAAPADPGTSAITGYVLTRTGSGQVVELPADATAHTWTGLSAGTSYTFTVRAVNDSGSGASATLTTVTTVVVPSAPRHLTAAWNPAVSAVDASWSVPLSTGGAAITGYAVYIDGTLRGTIGADSLGARISGMDPGVRTLGVAAVSPVGSGPAAETTVVVPAPAVLPTTTSLTATVSGRQVTLAASVTGGGTPAGAVRFVDGSVQLGTVSLGARGAVLRLSGVKPGSHSYRATFVPSSRHAGSTSSLRQVTVAAPALASRTRLTAPRTARAGSRPTVRVRVLRGTAPASGTVVLRYGAASKRLVLRRGAASFRLPRVKPGKVRLTATYTGNKTTRPSKATATIRIRRP